jgi:hypothetical protein
MWWRNQNLEKPISDPTGKRWNFRVWHDFVDEQEIQRIFFWDDEKKETGMVEFRGDKTIDHKKIKQRIIKIVHDASFRQKHLCALKFPIERHH